MDNLKDFYRSSARNLFSDISSTHENILGFVFGFVCGVVLNLIIDFPEKNCGQIQGNVFDSGSVFIDNSVCLTFS